ncbi:MAG: serine hydrolase domain-containing protein [Woeseiaceae bacterium]|nr:serine hydrolase domain-containing protein [Woeseiaceae bacterium]
MIRNMRNSSVDFIILLAALLLLLPTGCFSESTTRYAYRPPQQIDDGFDVGTLDEVGLNSALLAKAVDRIKDGRFGEVHSMLIFKDNRLVFEEYFPGHDFQWDGPNFHGAWVIWDRDTEHDVASVGKSITSACVGIAIEEGFIESAEDSIFAYLPEYQDLNTAGKDRITIEHLVTMTSGLEWDEWGRSLSDVNNDLIALWFCDDPVACILEKRLVSEPGTDFSYNSGNSVLLGEIILNATGMNIEAFSAEYLFKPMGIETVAWNWINDDVVYAGGGQRMTPREMLAFGVTYLNNGLWDGQQIVPAQWVEASAKPFPGPGSSWRNSRWKPIPLDDGTRGQRGYSYAWFTHIFSHAGQKLPSYWATGFGGQKIIVFPDQNAVVVFTSGNYEMPSSNAEILADFVIPAFG